MRILMYHEVTDRKPEDIHGVSKTEFDAQMRWLRQAGYRTVQFADWLADRSGTGPRLAANSIIITFDDGYLDNYAQAWPIMAEQGLSATIFLVAGRMGQTSDWRPGKLGQAQLLGWAQAREMARAGVRFGSHTMSHADLAKLEAPGLNRELYEARQRMEENLGEPVDTLAYPYGRFTPAVKDRCRQAGYQVACSCPTGFVGATNGDPYDLRRITLLANDHLADFIGKVRGNWRRRLEWYRQRFGAWRRRLVSQAG